MKLIHILKFIFHYYLICQSIYIDVVINITEVFSTGIIYIVE